MENKSVVMDIINMEKEVVNTPENRKIVIATPGAPIQRENRKRRIENGVSDIKAKLQFLDEEVFVKTPASGISATPGAPVLDKKCKSRIDETCVTISKHLEFDGKFFLRYLIILFEII